MTDKLLLELAEGSIEKNVFVKWLSSNTEDEYFAEFTRNVTRTDFVTYFLNFVHEELSRHGEQVQQRHSIINPVDIKKNDVVFDRKRSGPESLYLNKSTSFPLDKSFEKVLNEPTQEHPILSSPKLPKIHSDSVLNAPFSPLSPLYQKPTDFYTPKNKHSNSNHNKSAEKVSPLCLSDFILNTPVVKRKPKKGHSANDSVRRITPTYLNDQKVVGFQRTSNSFNNFDIKEIPVNNLYEHRNYLVEEKNKISKRCSNENNLEYISRKLKFVDAEHEIDANKSFVTNEKVLRNLANVYICVLNNSLVLNLTSELFFLIMLLTNKHPIKENKQIDDFQIKCLAIDDTTEVNNDLVLSSCSDLFRSIHDVIYFVVNVLESQIGILKCFDKTTLMLLSDNYRLKNFSKKLSEQLRKYSELKSDKVLEISDDLQHMNVYFNLDTDNRDNFPSEISFHSFRKQRDLFYEILRIWELNHLQPGWNFSVGLGGKIRSLLTLTNDPTNYIHLCRLFKDQLLRTCGKYHKDEDFSFLSSLPYVDAGKLSRLKNRLVNKQSNGLNASPSFLGYEEFFKDFIMTASNYMFSRHLSDIFIVEIMELNDTKFTTNDYEDSDVDVLVKKRFLTCLKYLKVLGKFLGYLESLPYRFDFTNYSDNLVQTHISIRQQISSSFDIKQLIVQAVVQRHIILTIPWVTDYLAMLDFITLKTPYYISVHKILFQLYKTYNNYEKNPYHNILLVKFSLGWLFELPNFPDSEFFTNLYETNNLQKSLEKVNKNDKFMDDLKIVDQHILYTFCPFLEEIKKLLLTDVTNNNATVKHITPVSAIHSGKEITQKKLEQQLEEAFFNAQPLSVRKTVEFVSERVASACVKHICHDMVPKFKQKSMEELEGMLKEYEENYDDFKEVLRSKVTDKAQSYLTALKEKCNRSVSDIIKEKIPSCIDNLLAIDTLPQTKCTCISIAVKMCKERIKQWNDSHLNISIFMKDFNMELQKLRKGEFKKNLKSKHIFALPSEGNKENHDDSSLSAAHLLETIKCLSVSILENPNTVTEDIVLDILKKSFITLMERCDVNEKINFYICTLLVDFSLLLVAHKPNIIQNQEIFAQFVKVWKEFYGKPEELFSNLLCPRNITLMAQPCKDEIVWSNMAIFVGFLINENILSCDNFEFQCTAFYQKNWDKAVLRNMSTFLQRFGEIYKNDIGNADKFSFLLDFLSDYCMDL